MKHVVVLGLSLGANGNVAAATEALPSLMGRAIFGLLQGASYARLRSGPAAGGCVRAARRRFEEGVIPSGAVKKVRPGVIGYV